MLMKNKKCALITRYNITCINWNMSIDYRNPEKAIGVSQLKALYCYPITPFCVICGA